MNIFGHEPSFWLAVGGATLFKVFSSRQQDWRRAVLTVSGAVFAAWVMTEPILAWMEWDAETYKVPTAAITALVGENIMRFLISLTPEKIMELLKEWRK